MIMYLAFKIGGFTLTKLIYLPSGFDIALVAQLFLFLGNKYRENEFLEVLKPINFLTLSLVLVFNISIILNTPVSMELREYGNIFLFYL